MSRIRGRDTKPEVLLRKALWHKGLRYRLKYPLLGKPDITFPRQKVAVFVDGCFWHRCPLHWVAPKNNAEFWEKKIAWNQRHDAEVNRQLRTEGWTVLRIWEHNVRKSLWETVMSIAESVGKESDNSNTK